MAVVSAQVDASQVQGTFRQLALADRREALASIGMLLVGAAKDNIAARSGPEGAWPKSPLSDLFAGPRIWRDISRSLRAQVYGLGDTVIVGSPHIAAAVRQQGTVGAGGTLPDIVPVAKKALTIPLSDPASKASYNGINARAAFPGSFIIHKKDGFDPASIGCIATYQGEGKNKKLVLLYKLVAKAAIRPHPFLPIDRAGQLSPATLWGEIEALISSTFLGGAA